MKKRKTFFIILIIFITILLVSFLLFSEYFKLNKSNDQNYFEYQQNYFLKLNKEIKIDNPNNEDILNLIKALENENEKLIIESNN